MEIIINSFMLWTYVSISVYVYNINLIIIIKFFFFFFFFLWIIYNKIFEILLFLSISNLIIMNFMKKFQTVIECEFSNKYKIR